MMSREIDTTPADEMSPAERVRVWLDRTEPMSRTHLVPDRICGYGGFTKSNPMRYLLRSDLEAVLSESAQARRTLGAIAEWTQVTDNGPGAFSISLLLNGVGVADAPDA